MVNNNKNKPPVGDNPSNEERKIPCAGALFDLSKVKELSAEGMLRTVTEKCDMHLAEMGLSLYGDVAEMIVRLVEGDYYESQWCKSSSTKAKGVWLKCDVYKTTKSIYNKHTCKDDHYDYYLKFSMGPTGKVILIVSCHPQQF